MNLALVILGPLDRRSGGYSYDVDAVAHLEGLGHRVAVWSLPSTATEARRVLEDHFTDDHDSTVVFDALVHDTVLETLEAQRSARRSRWVGLVHHLAWLEDPTPRPDTALKQERERRFLNLMDAFVFNSDDTRTTVATLRGPDAAFKPHVVCRPPLGPVPPRSSGPTDQGRLLFLGNLVPRKNLHGLLEALAIVNRRSPRLGWHLTVAGSPDLDPAYAAECRAQAQRDGLDAHVDWRGRVTEAEREELWAATDLFALPSFHEGWGMAHAEALARGVPALAVPQGGVLEVLGDAALWADADAVSLAQALERYLADGERRHRLGVLARHRSRVWDQNTGFDALGPFLDRLEDGEPAPEFSWSSYLEAKASIDSLSLHPRVREAAFRGAPVRSVIELGGGTGTMARRLREGGHLEASTRYLLVDQDQDSLSLAVERSAGLFDPGRFRVLCADLHDDWVAEQDRGPDLVVAHALLDLFDPRAMAPALAQLGARRYWLTHLFDGLTAWEPVVDPSLDRQLAEAYHRSMAERAPGGAQGGPRSGRDWLLELPRAGLEVREVASSDWIVRPAGGGYSEAEAVFLRSLLHFFRSSLTGRSDVNQAGLEWWLRVRRAQIHRGEASLVVHQLDLLAEAVGAV